MRTNVLNKVLGEKCPRCGQPVGETRCRQARNGWFCVQFGLEWDPERLLIPTPDAPALRDTHPEVAKAEKLEAEAQAAYERAETAWLEAVVRLRDLKDGPGGYHTPHYEWIPTRSKGKHKKLRAEEATTREARDEAAGELLKARAATRAALDRAKPPSGFEMFARSGAIVQTEEG